MPIKIPNNLPAFSTLVNENIFVMADEKASRQDIRPLKVAIVNLMPTKIVAGTKHKGLLSNTPLQVDITLVKTETHSQTPHPGHLENFYTTFNQIKRDSIFDALIITGAPVWVLDFNSSTLLEGAVRYNGVEQNSRIQHGAYLLGGICRTVLSLRYSEAGA